VGYDEDLNPAMKIAVEQMVHWLSTQSIGLHDPEGDFRQTGPTLIARSTDPMSASLYKRLPYRYNLVGVRS